MNRTIIVIAISFLIGVLLALSLGFVGDLNGTDIKIAWLIGQGIGFLIFVTILPLIISLVIYFKNKKWPHKLFVASSYCMLAVVTIYYLIVNLH